MLCFITKALPGSHQRDQGCGYILSKRKCRLNLGPWDKNKVLEREILGMESQDKFEVDWVVTERTV